MFKEISEGYDYFDEYLESVNANQQKARSQSQPQKDVQINTLLIEMEL